MDQKAIDFSDFKVSYDDSVDVLYVSFGERRPGIAMEINDGDFVRVDPYTDEVVGVTVLDFHERFVASISATIEESVQLVIPKILEKFRKQSHQILREIAPVPA